MTPNQFQQTLAELYEASEQELGTLRNQPRSHSEE